MIDSPANPLVKSMKALSEAKFRRAYRRYVVEGVRAIEDGIDSGFLPVACLYNTELLGRTERGTALIGRLMKMSPLSLYEASQRALAGAADTLHPQGIVASFAFHEWNLHDLKVARPLALICEDLRDPGNLGTLLRSAEAAGVTAVWTTPDTVDIYNPKVVRAAMGTHFRLPIFGEQSWASILQGLRAIGIPPERLYCTAAEAAQPYDAVDWKLPAALIISSEAHGLSPQARLACGDGAEISIPMGGGNESLNAAIAGAVILFEAARQRRRGVANA